MLKGKDLISLPTSHLLVFFMEANISPGGINTRQNSLPLINPLFTLENSTTQVFIKHTQFKSLYKTLPSTQLQTPINLWWKTDKLQWWCNQSQMQTKTIKLRLLIKCPKWESSSITSKEWLKSGLKMCNTSKTKKQENYWETSTNGSQQETTPCMIHCWPEW